MRARPPASTAASTVLALVALVGCSTSAPAAAASTSESESAPISPRVSVPTATDAAANGNPLGQAVSLSNGYTVAVTAVDLDAAAEMATLVPGVMSTNGRLVLVTLSAGPTQGTDPETSDPLALSLFLDLAGPNRTTISSVTRCEGTSQLRDPTLSVLAPGETVTWQECLDAAPEDAVPTSLVKVSDPLSNTTGSTAYWALD